MSGPVKLVFEASQLAAALRDARAAVQRRNTIPILHNVLIEAAADGAITITASDLDVMIVRRLRATQVSGAAQFTIAGHRLADVVSAFDPGAQVTLEIDGPAVVVKSGRARLRFSTLPATDFPLLPAPTSPTEFQIDAAALLRAISAVRHAISSEETRYYLNGIFAHVSAGKLRFAATDGHRLARYVTDVPAGADGMPDVILRTRCIELLRSATDESDQVLSVAIGRDRVSFDIDEMRIVAKVIDGTFPDYTRVIPASTTSSLDVDADALDGALHRVGLATDDKVRSVKLSVTREHVIASTTSPEHGEAVEEIASELDGTPIEIGFNLRYLRDAIGAASADTLRFGFGDAASPTLIHSIASDALTLVLMPMRV